MTRYLLPVALSPRPEYLASLPNESGCEKGQRGASPIRSRICVIGNRSRPTWLTVSAGVTFTGMKKKTSSVYDCTVEDVEYICNSNSTLCLFYFAIFVVLFLS